MATFLQVALFVICVTAACLAAARFLYHNCNGRCLCRRPVTAATFTAARLRSLFVARLELRLTYSTILLSSDRVAAVYCVW
jgi:hypothetical protein